jgi:hypothetical protein
MWSWWSTGDPDYNYYRIQSFGAELRKWFGSASNTPLTGFYAGVYGMSGTYDIRLMKDSPSDTGSLSDLSYSFGLTGGYSMPLGRRLNLELGLGVGYLGGEYKRYVRNNEFDCFPWVSTQQRSYFGPTKAKVSLVWLIGSGINKK